MHSPSSVCSPADKALLVPAGRVTGQEHRRREDKKYRSGEFASLRARDAKSYSIRPSAYEYAKSPGFYGRLNPRSLLLSCPLFRVGGCQNVIFYVFRGGGDRYPLGRDVFSSARGCDAIILVSAKENTKKGQPRRDWGCFQKPRFLGLLGFPLPS